MNKFSYLQKSVSLLIFCAIAYWLIYLYIDLSSLWIPFGRGEERFNPRVFHFEIPLVVLILSLGHFPQIKNWLLRFLLPVLPAIIFYVLFDGFYNNLGRSPSTTDLQNMGSLFAVLPTTATLVTILTLCIPAAILWLLLLAHKVYSPKTFQRSLLMRAAFIGLLLVSMSSNAFRQYHDAHFNYTVWSQEDTIRDNGRLSSLLYYYQQEQDNLKKLQDLASKSSHLNLKQILYPGKINQPRNIHLIVLESFIDPREIENIQLSRPILADELIPYLNQQKNFSLVKSPIYGGGTAQAEFELLTGVHAFSKVNKIEFNVMRGGAINSFVAALNENQYKTMATIATGAGFFNSKQAYTSLQFKNIVYLEDLESMKEKFADHYIFDGDVYDENIRQLKKTLAENDGPIFNYVLGMYGHTPFMRNQTLRPDIAEVVHPNEKVKRVANQFYYRTKALANYLKQLMDLDPNSIIYVTSDHLPSILNETTKYNRNNRINIALFFDQTKNIDVSGKAYYQLPWFIWDRLTEKENQRPDTEAEIEPLYFEALLESLST